MCGTQPRWRLRAMSGLLTLASQVTATTKIKTLFAVVGLLAGVLAAWFSVAEAEGRLDVLGPFFAFSVMVSATMVGSFGWTAVPHTVKRWLAFVLLISVSARLVYWTMALLSLAFELTCHALTNEHYCIAAQSSDWGILFLSTLSVGTIGVTSVSLGLRVLTGKWFTRQVGWLIALTIFITFVSISMTYLLQDTGLSIVRFHEDWTLVFILSALGFSSLGAVCGSWIVQAGGQVRVVT
jgi:hypothetical protein